MGSKTPRMVVGILSALRKPPTVLSVAAGLVRNVDRSIYEFLVWQAFSASRDHQTKDLLEKLGFTVFTQQALYPELEDGHLQYTLGDTKERMLWRAGHGEGVCGCVVCVWCLCGVGVVCVCVCLDALERVCTNWGCGGMEQEQTGMVQ